jgi:hypothetical protein
MDGIIMMMIITTFAADAAHAALHITYDIIFLFFNLKLQEEIKLFIKKEMYTMSKHLK